MKGKILITDSLFIFPEHEQILRDSGYEIERLDKTEATEDELVHAIKGKVGYILGGIEKITNDIIDASDQLKAIVFTGIGYKDFIPNFDYVTTKGISIANTPNAPTHAVAEWALTMALAMNRNIFDLGRVGEKKFMTSKGIEGQSIGIVGFGRIGKEIGRMLKVFKPKEISYYSKNRHTDAENELGIVHKELDNLLGESDIVFLCLPKDAGENFIGERELSLMMDGALIVSFMHRGPLDESALLAELKSKRIRAVSDYNFDNPEFENLPLSNWYCFNGSNAFNTESEIKLTSDMATTSIINLLERGVDENKVN